MTWISKLTIKDPELSRRKLISFEEAEGLHMPARQLERDEISPELRSVIWMTVHNSMTVHNNYGHAAVSDEWRVVLANKHVLRDHKMIDELNLSHDRQVQQLKFEFQTARFDKFYGLIQWLLRDESIPSDFTDHIEIALEHCRSPYRVMGGDTLVPVANDETANAIREGITGATDHGLVGAAEHLKRAGGYLSDGRWADSVRESLHAVESCARLFAPGSNGLGPALKILGDQAGIHEAMRRGFGALYGYASDQDGIRHALLETGDAKVSEADASFMLGACASFVSYLIFQNRVLQKDQ